MPAEIKYCYTCGAKLVEKHLEGRIRKWCDSCNLVNYENPIPSVAVLIIDENNRILLTKRGAEPAIGLWCLPGGFIELGETVEDTVIREVAEETGLRVIPVESLGHCSKINGYHGDVILLGYTAEVTGGELHAGDDAVEAQYFDLDELPDIAFNCHKYFIEKKFDVEVRRHDYGK